MFPAYLYSGLSLFSPGLDGFTAGVFSGTKCASKVMKHKAGMSFAFATLVLTERLLAKDEVV